mgnify:CR=1 FL=1
MKKSQIDISLISQVVLSVLVIIMGIVIMIFKSFGLLDMILYTSILFFIFSFFSVICYFIKRKEGDYEILLLALINIITATFMFALKSYDNEVVLGTGMVIFTVLMLANRCYKIFTLKSENNYMWTVKFICTFLIGFLGMLTCINLYKAVTVPTLMFGYYFISLGVILTIESVFELCVTQDMFDKLVNSVVDSEYNNLEMIDAIKNEDEVKEASISMEKMPGKKVSVKVNGKDVGKEVKKEVKPIEKKIKRELKPVKKEVKKKVAPVKKEIDKKVKPEKKDIEKNIVKPIKKEVKKAKREVEKEVVKETIKRKVGRPRKEK